MKNRHLVKEDLNRFNQIMGYNSSTGLINEAWSDMSQSQRLKFGLAGVATMAGVVLLYINHVDTKVTKPDGTVRSGVAGEEFTGIVTYSNRGRGNFHNVGIKCDDGTLVDISIDLRDIVNNNINIGSTITISVTEDTWLYRDDAIVNEDQTKGLVKEEGEEYPEGWTDELEEIYKDAYYRYMDGYQGAKYYTREDILRQHLNNPKPQITKTKENKVTIEITEDEARLLLGCLMRTNASGEMLGVGEMVEEIILKQLNQNKD